RAGAVRLRGPRGCMRCGAWLAAAAALRAQRATGGIPRNGGVGRRADRRVPAPRLLARLRRAALQPCLAARVSHSPPLGPACGPSPRSGGVSGGGARPRALPGRSPPGGVPLLGAVASFSPSLLVSVSSLLETRAAPGAGAGPNASLKTPYMLAPPPLLYLGY